MVRKKTVTPTVGENIKEFSYELGVRDEHEIKNLVSTVLPKQVQINILHNSVGTRITGQDTTVEKITAEGFDNIVAINLRLMLLPSKHLLTHLREDWADAPINISSLASIKPFPLAGHKNSRAAVIALREQLANGYALSSMRANFIFPYLINTTMAIEGRVGSDKPRNEIIAERDRLAPLSKNIGSA